MKELKIHWSNAHQAGYINEKLFDAGFDRDKDIDMEIDDDGNKIYTQED